MRFRLALFSAALLFAAAPAHAAWHEAKSKHFIVYADEDPRELKRYAEKLERFDQAVRYVRKMDDPDLSDSGRVKLFVLPDAESVGQLLGSFAVRGFYVTRASGSYAFVPRRSGSTMIMGASGGIGLVKDSLNAQEVFFHEYAHHLQLQNWAGVMPVWVSEGFAEFFATAEIDKNGNVTIGKFPSYRSWEVFLGNSLSADEVVSADYENLNFYEIYALYGRSWLLTHYLTMSANRRGQLNRYLDGIEKGMKPRDSAKAAFGDLKALQHELDDYIKPRTVLGLTVGAQVIPIGPVTVRQLASGQAAMMPVQIRSKAGVNKDTAPKVAGQARRIAAAFPHDPAVQSALSEAEFDAKNYAAAEAAADRALAADPTNLDALIYKGRSELELAKAKSAQANWDEIRAWFTRANKVDTENAEPLALFYETFAAAGQRPSSNALDALLYAVDLAPRDDDLRMSAVRALVLANKLKDAKELFAPVAYEPHLKKDMRQIATKIMTALGADDSKSAVSLLDTAAEIAKKDND
jgi:tetratricopeptide (TPR) repeat protein